MECSEQFCKNRNCQNCWFYVAEEKEAEDEENGGN